MSLVKENAIELTYRPEFGTKELVDASTKMCVYKITNITVKKRNFYWVGDRQLTSPVTYSCCSSHVSRVKLLVSCRGIR